MKQYSKEALLRELGERLADEKFHDGMTMSEMELAAEETVKRDAGPPPVAAMLSRMKPEKPTAKACPKCGKRTPVKARDRERTVKSLRGACASEMADAHGEADSGETLLFPRFLVIDRLSLPGVGARRAAGPGGAAR